MSHRHERQPDRPLPKQMRLQLVGFSPFGRSRGVADGRKNSRPFPRRKGGVSVWRTSRGRRPWTACRANNLGVVKLANLTDAAPCECSPSQVATPQLCVPSFGTSCAAPDSPVRSPPLYPGGLLMSGSPLPSGGTDWGGAQLRAARGATSVFQPPRKNARVTCPFVIAGASVMDRYSSPEGQWEAVVVALVHHAVLIPH